jgi:hypothetical protein
VALFDDFSVSSWEAISKGGLLLGLETDRTRKLLQVYSSIYKANKLQADLREAAMRGAMPNAMMTAQTASQEYRSMLKAALDDLDAAFRDLGMPHVRISLEPTFRQGVGRARRVFRTGINPRVRRATPTRAGGTFRKSKSTSYAGVGSVFLC